MEKIKEYTNGEITVVWKPGICIHSAKCAHGLPNVFKPKEKPWIQVENASTSELVKTIDTCPSGALSYFKNSAGRPKEEFSIAQAMKVEVVKNGPLLVFGNIDLTHETGETESKKRSTAFCRCGNSKNQPFCDGSHNN